MIESLRATAVHIPDGVGWRSIGWTEEPLRVTEAPQLDMQLTAEISEPGREQATSGVEPCERCGTPIRLMDFGSWLRAMAAFVNHDPPAALASEADKRRWHEVHQNSTPGSLTIGYRPHTPERCTRARGGDPEPFTFDTDDEDDDWD